MKKLFGVTISLDTKYRKPVPYETNLIAKGMIVKNTHKFFTTESSIMDLNGNLLANGSINYIKLDADKIADNISIHEEMCYLVDDNINDITFNN